MKSSFLSIIVGVVITVVVLGYILSLTSPSSAVVGEKSKQLITPAESKAIKTNILSDKTLQETETYKTFGQHPVSVDGTTLNRTNPFEGF